MHFPHPLVTRLTELETLKTWSLIVTLFGDLDGRELSGAQIRALLGHIGIKPEAIRVALHRLRCDGWIASQKSGREAMYSLSEQGRMETDAANADVYDLRVKYPAGWQFLLVDEGFQATRDMITLSRNLALVPADAARGLSDTFALAPVGHAVPEWIEAALLPPQMLKNAEGLIRTIEDVPGVVLDPTDLNSLRLLTVHHWRRLALRPGSWAHIGLMPDGVMARCHAIVTAYLSTTARLSC